jgi:polysaccharide biosynthesis/export protein
MTLPEISSPIKRSAAGLVVLTFAALTSATPVQAQSLTPPPNQAPVPQGQIPPAQPGMMVPVPAPNTMSIQQFDQEAYLLGPGDRITLELFNQPEISKTYAVLNDGTVSLPMVGNVSVRGLTLKQAAAVISTQYARFFRRPATVVRLEASRPINIGISGQVFRPGTYVVPSDRNPKLSYAIQSAGGISPRADIRNVQVRRPQMGRPDTIINVDLMRMLQGDLNQDVTLRDGDSIVIPQSATALTPEEMTMLATTTFSPSTINVNVVGEVKGPGLRQLTPNIPINQAILAAGGFVPGRSNPNKVQLIRLNPDGTVSQRELKIDLAQGLNVEGNPALQNNDVIVVGRSGAAVFGDRLNQFLAPFNGVTSVVTGGLGRLILPLP